MNDVKFEQQTIHHMTTGRNRPFFVDCTQSSYMCVPQMVRLGAHLSLVAKVWSKKVIKKNKTKIN